MRIKYARKLLFFIMWLLHVQLLGYSTDSGICESLWSNRLDCQLMTMLKTMYILQAQVCGCISAHPRLPHQKIKRETVMHQKSAKSSKLK